MSGESDVYIQNVFERLGELRKQANNAAFHISNLMFIQDDEGEQHEWEQSLDGCLQSQYRLLCDALEKLKSQSSLAELQQGFARFTDLHELRPHPTEGDLISPVQHFLSDYIELLSMHIKNEPETHAQEALKIFENILAGTAMLMEQLKTPPKNETEINRFMKKVVSAAFPDTIAPSIPTSIKTYKPEFGVPSLAALAEYKFADSEEILKQCLDGIMTDSRGYQADGKWQRFYAVLFMTGAFFSQAQIESHFKQCGIPDSWKPIVLVGKGGKKKTVAQQPTPPADTDTTTDTPATAAAAAAAAAATPTAPA